MNDLQTAAPGQSGKGALPSGLVLALSLALFSMLFWCHSWLGDDCFITLRVADNWRHGLGLVWNVGERVQVYTHPLWLFCILLAQQALHNQYFCVLGLSWLCGAALVALLVLRAKDLALACAGIFILFSSRFFIDYSSSGLENPLSHLLAFLFCAGFYAGRAAERSPRDAVGLYLLACLLMLTRQDLMLLTLPAVGYLMLRQAQSRGWARALGQVALGFAPWLGWEAFSLLYYGFPFPNTAYAKLGTGLPHSASLGQGLLYFKDSLMMDWVLLPATALGLAWAALAGGAEGMAAALGGLLYLAYVLWVGGDFMAGRFFTAPLVLAVASLVLLPKARWALPASALLALLALAQGYSPLLCRIDVALEQPCMPAGVFTDGVVDEKSYYYATSALVNCQGQHPWPQGVLAEAGLRWHEACRESRRVYTFASIGLVGYDAGPRAFIIDLNALADPLLAHLPAQSSSRIGHFTRSLPGGYVESIIHGRPCFQDPGLAAYYGHLCMLTRAPLFAPGRLREILRFNLGAYEPLKAGYLKSLQR